jgi:SAM-dependent methyltransferase
MSDTAARRETGAPPSLSAVQATVEAYYSDRLARFGASPMGVDWSCEATQNLRFVQLLKLCDTARPFSLNDLGCGYGALAVFIRGRFPDADVDYLGIDLSRSMIARARRRHRGKPNVRFVVGSAPTRIADYSVASGIMNVKLDQPMEIWETFVRTMLEDLHRASRIGFAVNFMEVPTKGAPPDQLYCPPPARWARYCEEILSCDVTIIRNYGLRENTLLAKRPVACA